MEEAIQRILDMAKKETRYALKGEFGLDWEEFLYTIIQIKSEEDKRSLKSMSESLISDFMKRIPHKNYLEAFILISLIEYLKNKQEDSDLVFYHSVNTVVLFVFKNNKYTNEELKVMIERYKDDFDQLTSLSKNELPLRENILYTIIMLNVLSYRVVETGIPGVYTNAQIRNGTFVSKLLEMTQKRNG